MSTTRREFLKQAMLGTTVTVLAPRILTGGLTSPRGRALVILQLAGGNDSLNTLIPYTDPLYRKLRPELAIAEAAIHPVTERFGFHPAMAPLLHAYKDGSLAFVNDVGFPSLDRSHFRCQDVWQTADEGTGRDRKQRIGWAGRYADAYLAGSDSTLTTIAIGSKIPLGMTVRRKRPTVLADARAFRLAEPGSPSMPRRSPRCGISTRSRARTSASRA